jgi:hypothetical protein
MPDMPSAVLHSSGSCSSQRRSSWSKQQLAHLVVGEARDELADRFLGQRLRQAGTPPLRRVLRQTGTATQNASTRRGKAAGAPAESTFDPDIATSSRAHHRRTRPRGQLDAR